MPPSTGRDHPRDRAPGADAGGVRAALDRARMEQGAAAIAWLERARALAPDDPTVAFLLASAVLAREPARALDILLALLAGHPGCRDAKIAAVACELRLGRPDAAAARLGALLAGCAPPPGPHFRALADEVCRDSGAAGWIGVDAAGHIAMVAPGPVALLCDGRPIPPPRPGRKPPAGLARATALAATHGGAALLGSPVDLAARRRTEGFFDLAPDGALVGWAWLPGDPDRPAPLTLLLDGARQNIRADDDTLDPAPGHVLDRRRGFSIPAASVAGAETIRVIGLDGRDLAGGPLHPRREPAVARALAARVAAAHGGAPAPEPAGIDCFARHPLDAALAARAAPPVAARRHGARAVGNIDIVIPVWRGAADFLACLASLRQGNMPGKTRIVVVDDATPDAELRGVLDTLAAEKTIHVLRHEANRGFPAAANTAMREAARAGRDVLLLNPDTLPPPGAVARLARAAHAAPDIGTVTPMSNDGTLVSYPPAIGIDAADAVRRLDALFEKSNGAAVVELPTGVGFCLYIRHDCLVASGLFREQIFAQGYGEENDFCLRARHLGWRHVAAVGVFVAHRGGASFGAVKADLIARNTRLLNRLHPGYDAMIADFLARDPLAPARRAVDVSRWVAGRARAGAVALISHGQGGGVARHVAERAAAIRAEGRRPIFLTPPPDGLFPGVALADDTAEQFSDLRFALPTELPGLTTLLAGEKIARVELHHFIGHRLDPVALAKKLGAPLDIVAHDSALWCPRVTLTGAQARYCGEPADIVACETCVRDLGGRLRDDISVAALRARSAGWLRAAARVVVACEDGARRLARQFPQSPHPAIIPWEDFSPPPGSLSPPRAAASGAGVKKIIVVGAIGPEKGYSVLLDCARDAARRGMGLEFVVVGHTVDDARLLETGRVFVTGKFAEGRAADLVAGQNGDLGFIPSVIPESWCYALTALWRGGLRVACFALGAQAERVARAGARADAGAVLPLGLPPARLNDVLLALAAGAPVAPR